MCLVLGSFLNHSILSYNLTVFYTSFINYFSGSLWVYRSLLFTAFLQIMSSCASQTAGTLQQSTPSPFSHFLCCCGHAFWSYRCYASTGVTVFTLDNLPLKWLKIQKTIFYIYCQPRDFRASFLYIKSWFLCLITLSYPPAWRIVSRTAGLVLMNRLSFGWSEKVVISLSFLKDAFSGCGVLVSHIFCLVLCSAL